ncbi:hypothetical protein BC628DRAFT_1194622 [Trametes gibbosa]|nr:hypothetical protein BC628DRAFT_1194622 [Trametes gibbosa]
MRGRVHTYASGRVEAYRSTHRWRRRRHEGRSRRTAPSLNVLRPRPACSWHRWRQASEPMREVPRRRKQRRTVLDLRTSRGMLLPRRRETRGALLYSIKTGCSERKRGTNGAENECGAARRTKVREVGWAINQKKRRTSPAKAKGRRDASSLACACCVPVRSSDARREADYPNRPGVRACMRPSSDANIVAAVHITCGEGERTGRLAYDVTAGVSGDMCRTMTAAERGVLGGQESASRLREVVLNADTRAGEERRQRIYSSFCGSDVDNGCRESRMRCGRYVWVMRWCTGRTGRYVHRID